MNVKCQWRHIPVYADGAHVESGGSRSDVIPDEPEEAVGLASWPVTQQQVGDVGRNRHHSDGQIGNLNSNTHAYCNSLNGEDDDSCDDDDDDSDNGDDDNDNCPVSA